MPAKESEKNKSFSQRMNSQHAANESASGLNAVCCSFCSARPNGKRWHEKVF
jgi:hypothetical protein